MAKSWLDLLRGRTPNGSLTSAAAAAAKRVLERAGSLGRALAAATGFGKRRRPTRATAKAATTILEAAQAAGVNVDQLLDDEAEEPEDAIELLPRAEYPRLPDEQVFDSQWIHVGSSNVYAFNFQTTDRRSGILYVQFLNWAPGSKERSGPGPTYAYYDVPVSKWVSFKQAATNGSAGGAVWDYLRVRGSVYLHQHQYTLQRGGITTTGEQYVPRRSTAKGLRKRTLTEPGTGRRGGVRSQLPEVLNGKPNRGTPRNGAPNRGTPNTGR